MQSHFVRTLLPLWVVDSMQLIGSNVKHNQLDMRSFCNGGGSVGGIGRSNDRVDGGLGFKFAFVKNDSREGAYGGGV